MSNAITHEQIPPGFSLAYHLNLEEGTTIKDLAWSPDGRMLALVDSNYSIRICNAEDGQTIWKLNPLFSELRITWSPDGQTLAIGCGDNSIRLLDIKTATFQDEILTGHSDWVWNLQYSPDGTLLASNSRDKTICLWNTTTWDIQEIIEVEGWVWRPQSLAWSPDSKYLFLGYKRLLSFWNVETGDEVATFKQDSGLLSNVVLSPQKPHYLAISSDKNIIIWADKAQHILEKHNEVIISLSFSADGRLLASQDIDDKIIIWRCDIWETVAVLPNQNHVSNGGIAFHPTQSKLAILNQYGTRLSVWNLDIDFLLNAAEGFESVRYRNAKVVLVGDSGVGKSGLGTVLAGEEFQPTVSTHGRHVWSLEVSAEQSKDGVEESREILLWDLAGQAEFRLIHQLSLDQTNVALVLFDGSSPTDPFKGVEFWNKALRQAKGSENLVKYLVAARTDVSSLTVTDERMNEFASKLGFQGVFKTSALTGKGVEELLEQIKQTIDWKTIHVTVSERLFKQMKDFVVNQKKNNHILKTVQEMSQQFRIIYPEARFQYTDFRAAIERVETHNLVKLLSFGDYVLLQPEILDNYASAMARSAREQPDGLGFLDESAARLGEFDFGSLERVSEEKEQIILQSVVELFITKELAILDHDKLVFPSQFNRELPEYPNVDGLTVSYQFEGAILNAYATLVVRLYHSEAFQFSSCYKNAAIFLPFGFKSENYRCGFILEEIEEGTGKLTIFFGEDVPEPTKILFLKYIHEHLSRKSLDGKVKRERLYRCPQCFKDVRDREAVKSRLERGLSIILCQYCDAEIKLKDLIEETFGKNDEFMKKVRQIDEKIDENLDNASKEAVLKGEVMTIAGKAGQIFRPTSNDDNGIDGEIEFKNSNQEATGERIYIQLKSGDSYLKIDKRGNFNFYIEKERHIEYWLSQKYDVYLIIRDGDGKIYWMNITEYLKRWGDPKPRTIVIPRDEFTVESLRQLKQKKLGEVPKPLKSASKKSTTQINTDETESIQLSIFDQLNQH